MDEHCGSILILKRYLKNSQKKTEVWNEGLLDTRIHGLSKNLTVPIKIILPSLSFLWRTALPVLHVPALHVQPSHGNQLPLLCRWFSSSSCLNYPRAIVSWPTERLTQTCSFRSSQFCPSHNHITCSSTFPPNTQLKRCWICFRTTFNSGITYRQKLRGFTWLTMEALCCANTAVHPSWHQWGRHKTTSTRTWWPSNHVNSSKP